MALDLILVNGQFADDILKILRLVEIAIDRCRLLAPAFNVIAGFLAFHYLPEGNLQVGIALIMVASAFLLWRNNAKSAVAA